MARDLWFATLGGTGPAESQSAGGGDTRINGGAAQAVFLGSPRMVFDKSTALSR